MLPIEPRNLLDRQQRRPHGADFPVANRFCPTSGDTSVCYCGSVGIPHSWLFFWQYCSFPLWSVQRDLPLWGHGSLFRKRSDDKDYFRDGNDSLPFLQLREGTWPNGNRNECSKRRSFICFSHSCQSIRSDRLITSLFTKKWILSGVLSASESQRGLKIKIELEEVQETILLDQHNIPVCTILRCPIWNAIWVINPWTWTKPLGCTPHLRLNSFDICIHAEQEAREPLRRKIRVLPQIRLRSGWTYLAILKNAQKAAHDHLILVPRCKHARHCGAHHPVWIQGPRTDKLRKTLRESLHEYSLSCTAEYRNNSSCPDKSVLDQFLHHSTTI